MPKPWFSTLSKFLSAHKIVFCAIYNSVIFLWFYKLVKFLIRRVGGQRTELYRICNTALVNSPSWVDVGNVKSIVLSSDKSRIEEWRDGLGRRLGTAPAMDPFIIFRIEQSLLHSTRLRVCLLNHLFTAQIARREGESRYARIPQAIQPILTLKGFDCELERPSYVSEGKSHA